MDVPTNELSHLMVGHRARENDESQVLQPKCHLLADGVGEASILFESGTSGFEHGFCNSGEWIVRFRRSADTEGYGFFSGAFTLGFEVGTEFVDIGEKFAVPTRTTAIISGLMTVKDNSRGFAFES
jgi:hypothetical protein